MRDIGLLDVWKKYHYPITIENIDEHRVEHHQQELSTHDDKEDGISRILKYVKKSIEIDVNKRAEDLYDTKPIYRTDRVYELDINKDERSQLKILKEWMTYIIDHDILSHPQLSLSRFENCLQTLKFSINEFKIK